MTMRFQAFLAAIILVATAIVAVTATALANQDDGDFAKATDGSAKRSSLQNHRQSKHRTLRSSLHGSRSSQPGRSAHLRSISTARLSLNRLATGFLNILLGLGEMLN